jgi:hypothetical protein
MGVQCEPEWVFKMNRNECSRWAGICRFLTPAQERDYIPFQSPPKKPFKITLIKVLTNPLPHSICHLENFYFSILEKVRNESGPI